MKYLKRDTNLIIVLLLNLSLYSQTYTLTGSTYNDRCESFVNAMNSVNPMGVNSDPKYVGPYFFAKLYKNVDVNNTNKELETMYDKYLNDPTLYYGSPVKVVD